MSEGNKGAKSTTCGRKSRVASISLFVLGSLACATAARHPSSTLRCARARIALVIADAGVGQDPGGGTMASTNEDVVALATAPFGDSRLLVLRHLPDRGTVEIGWWNREAGGAVTPGPSVLELVAEPVEVGAAARLCEGLLADAGWDAAGEGETLAETPTFADGARVVAVRSGSGMVLVRRPEGGDLALPSRAALDLLTGLFPAARQKLGALGFGLIGHGGDALAATAEDQA